MGSRHFTRRSFWKSALAGVPILGGILLTNNTTLAQESSPNIVQGRSEDVLTIPTQVGLGSAYRFIPPFRIKGLNIVYVPLPGVTRSSLVFASIAEWSSRGEKFIGSAKFTVHSIAPRDGDVAVMLNIEWGADLLVAIDVMVVNP